MESDNAIDPLQALRRRVLAEQPDPPRKVSTWQVLRAEVDSPGMRRTLRSIESMVALAGLVYFLAILASLYGVAYALKAATIATLFIPAFILFVLPFAAQQIAGQLRKAELGEAEVLDVDVKGRFDPRKGRGAATWYATGRYRVFATGRTFETVFAAQEPWARLLIQGSRIEVLIDPKANRVLDDLGLMPGTRIARQEVQAVAARPPRRIVIAGFGAAGLVLLLLTARAWVDASASQSQAEKHSSAPLCPQGTLADGCRGEVAATVDSVHESNASSEVVVSLPGGNKARLYDSSWAFSHDNQRTFREKKYDLYEGLKPGTAVSAEYWQGKIVALHGPEGRTMIASDHPGYIAQEGFTWATILGLVTLICVGICGTSLWRRLRWPPGAGSAYPYESSPANPT